MNEIATIVSNIFHYNQFKEVIPTDPSGRYTCVTVYRVYLIGCIQSLAGLVNLVSKYLGGTPTFSLPQDCRYYSILSSTACNICCNLIVTSISKHAAIEVNSTTPSLA